jgi:DNA-3-methyladenine glycosylase
VTGGWSKWRSICQRSAGIKPQIVIITTQSALINAVHHVQPDCSSPRPEPAQGLPDAFFRPRRPDIWPGIYWAKLSVTGSASLWLSARIIETEAYYCEEKGSHASLGYTEKRKALFLDGGHIYMYYARGGDSLNFSAQGPGNAVLIKSAYPWVDELSGPASLAQMLLNNPDAQGRPRPSQKLCAGQTLLCKSLGLKVPVWDAKRFDHEAIAGGGRRPATPPISSRPPAWAFPSGRDEHLMYRFVDAVPMQPIARGTRCDGGRSKAAIIF